MTRVPPWTIIAGLGTLDREAICDLLAIFRDAGLINLANDRFLDLARAISKRKELGDREAAFKKRLTVTSKGLFQSADTDDLLRLRLWAALRTAFGFPAVLPFSVRSAEPASSDLAWGAAVALAGLIPKPAAESEGLVSKASTMASKVKSLFGNDEQPSFDDIVTFQAMRLTAQAAENDLFDEADKSALVRMVRERLSQLPPELRDAAVEDALKKGDTAALGLLVSGSSLVGLGIAVDLAGFAAYQLAAQASAFLPLIGGKAAVSGLFVLANPVFIIPALIGGGALMGKGLHDSVRKRLAANLIVMLALRGLAVGHSGLQTCLDGFRNLDPTLFRAGDLGEYADTVIGVRTRFGGSLPPCPSVSPETLSRPISGQCSEALAGLLFSEVANSATETAALAGLTIGDIVYSAASIDPHVIMAADFSRSEDLLGLFQFGAFADRVTNFAEASLTGVQNNLRGYIAERMVATRLIEQGHQVEFPQTANYPGIDLFVDGEGFQVKCLSGISGLARHFEKYPDIPVFVNSELAEKAMQSDAEWAVMVHSVEGFDFEVADHLLRQGLEAGSDLMNVHLHIPLFAAAVSSARNLHGWWKGTIPLSNLPFEIAIGGAVKGGLAVAGGLAGKGLGLLLLGPAGAVVGGGLGGVASIMGQGRVRSTIDEIVDPAWSKGAALACRNFTAAMLTTLEKKASLLDKKLTKLATEKGAEVRWIHDRIADDRLFIIEGICRVATIHKMSSGTQSSAHAALRAMHDHAVHPWSVRSELSALLDALNTRPNIAAIASEKSIEAAKWAKSALQIAFRNHSWK